MRESKCGYTFPVIDNTLCVDCGLCEKVCPTLNPLPFNNAPKHTYAAVCNDDEERRTSSSGGLSSLICRHIIKKGGVVYGCAEENYKEIHHIRVDKEDDLNKLKGSKYVQSEIGCIYKEVKKDLLVDRYVAFCGTPCQIAGLKSYLRKDYEKLYTLDLICHGVPSQKMLRDDIEVYLKNENDEDVFVSFRWKAQFGIQFGIQLGNIGEKGITPIKSIAHPYDPYILAFMTGYSFRENCHTCPYSQEKRIGDITIGDFWRLGAYKPTELKIKHGVSLILANTDKGNMLIEEIKPQLSIKERMLQEAVDGNTNLKFPSPRPVYKDLFLKTYKEKGLNEACKTVIPIHKFYKIVLVEALQRCEWLVRLYKMLRLMMLKK